MIHSAQSKTIPKKNVPALTTGNSSKQLQIGNVPFRRLAPQINWDIKDHRNALRFALVLLTSSDKGVASP
jgi:hypothetical protein